MQILKKVGKDAHWEGNCWRGRRSGKEGQMLQKHLAKSSNVSQAWADMDGSNPRTQGS